MIGKKRDNIDFAAQTAEGVAKRSENIIKLRTKECLGYEEYHSFADIRGQKVLAVISQVSEIVSDRWSVLNSFFIQRDMKSKNNF